MQITGSRGRSLIQVQGAEFDPGPGGGDGSRSRGGVGSLPTAF